MAFSNTDQIPLSDQIALSTASAKNQMAFQERMSNTAHQREVEDLKAAGLNPILSAHSQGASTPSGAEGDYGFDQMASLAAQSIATSAKAVSGLSGAVNTLVKNNYNNDVLGDLKELVGLGSFNINDPNSTWQGSDWLQNTLHNLNIRIPGVGNIKNLDQVVMPVLSAWLNTARKINTMKDYDSSVEGNQTLTQATGSKVKTAINTLKEAAIDAKSKITGNNNSAKKNSNSGKSEILYSDSGKARRKAATENKKGTVLGNRNKASTAGSRVHAFGAK